MKHITKLTLTVLVALALGACGGQAPTTGAPTGTPATGAGGTSTSTSGTPDMSMTSTTGMGETSTSESTPQISETSVPTLASTSAAGSSTSVATGTAPAGTATDVLTNSDVLTGTSGTSVPGANTIGGVLASDPRISTLRGLVEATGLENTLSQTNASFTLFAPADTAFATLPPETLRTVLADMAKVREILSYHVVQRKLTSADLASSTSLTTLQGETLTLSSSGGVVTINGKVKLVGAPIETGNGVIYIIDQVLLPSTVKLSQ
jgi:uncharacterized surface protein with fasciclin (FAS1) repeats